MSPAGDPCGISIFHKECGEGENDVYVENGMFASIYTAGSFSGTVL